MINGREEKSKQTIKGNNPFGKNWAIPHHDTSYSTGLAATSTSRSMLSIHTPLFFLPEQAVGVAPVIFQIYFAKMASTTMSPVT